MSSTPSVLTRKSSGSPRRRRRVRTDSQVARLRRALRHAVTVRPYNEGLWRIVMLRERCEITVAPDELELVLGFVYSNLGATMLRRLPVDEFARVPWGRNYRWSARANAIYIAATEGREVAA